MSEKEIELKVCVNDLDDDWTIENHLKSWLKLPENRGFKHYRILKKSLDARKKRIYFNFRILFLKESNIQVTSEQWVLKNKLSDDAHKVAIIGFGPAGIFAALEAIELGLKPIIFERGKEVRRRRRDVAILNREGVVDEESNYCFGEGGAGTFSDGKLYTRSKKRGDYKKVLSWFVMHGAADKIVYESKPHIGTNKLPGIIEKMRESIIAAGGEVHFDSKLTNFSWDDNGITEVEINGNRRMPFSQMILATGHSSRMIFNLLHQKGVLIEAKPFALGLRVEHPQPFIDYNQYHGLDSCHLPPAYYNVVTQAVGEGVFSFCMCPGGIIAPASTKPNEIVVNGWSPSNRKGTYANSGFVTSVGEKDWTSFANHGPLAALKFQESIEQKAYQMVHDGVKAPAQKLVDFIDDKVSEGSIQTSYVPGVVSVNLNTILPPNIAKRLREGFKQINKKWPQYIHPDAVVVGVESRTSSPVRIPRERDLQHPEIKGLFPCGEGAGYAGGIVSAAIDGMRCVQSIKELI